jgi:LysR family nitrogen assimilation transcriptional regulator
VSFAVTVGSTDELVEAMLKGAVDVAVINPVPDDRLFYRDLLEEDLMVVGGPQSRLQPSSQVTFAELIELPLVIPRSHTGIGNVLQNAALRTKVNISYRTTTDSLQVAKSLIEAGLAYAVLPLSACGREVDDGRLRFAPLAEPTLTHQLGMAATAQLDLPREFAVKVANTMREEAERLVKAGSWPARFLSPHPWNPNIP